MNSPPSSASIDDTFDRIDGTRRRFPDRMCCAHRPGDDDASDGDDAARRRGLTPWPAARWPRPRLADRRQAGRGHLRRRGGQGEVGARRAEGGPRRHARSGGDRPARHRLRRGDQDRPLRRRCPQGLPLHRALGCRDRTDDADGAVLPPPTRPRARTPAIRDASRPSPARSCRCRRRSPAVKVDGERAYALARAGEIARSRRPAAPCRAARARGRPRRDTAVSR